ncbi:MAG: SurA N-terminal domain-containing protein [bacterium]
MIKYIIIILLLLASAAPCLGQADDYALIINGGIISKKVLQPLITDIKKEYGGNFDNLSAEKEIKLKESFKQAIDDIIDTELIRQGSKIMRIKVSSKEVNDRTNDIIKSFPSKDEFMKSLKDNNMSMDIFKNGIETILMREKIVKVLAKDIIITDKEIYDFAQHNKEVNIQDMQDSIKKYLFAQKAGVIFHDWLSREKSKAKITYHPNLKWVMGD